MFNRRNKGRISADLEHHIRIHPYPSDF